MRQDTRRAADGTDLSNTIITGIRMGFTALMYRQSWIPQAALSQNYQDCRKGILPGKSGARGPARVPTQAGVYVKSIGQCASGASEVFGKAKQPHRWSHVGSFRQFWLTSTAGLVCICDCFISLKWFNRNSLSRTHHQPTIIILLKLWPYLAKPRLHRDQAPCPGGKAAPVTHLYMVSLLTQPRYSSAISVSWCTTTLVTDMSGCCSFAAFIACARTWKRPHFRACHRGSSEG